MVIVRLARTTDDVEGMPVEVERVLSASTNSSVNFIPRREGENVQGRRQRLQEGRAG